MQRMQTGCPQPPLDGLTPGEEFGYIPPMDPGLTRRGWLMGGIALCLSASSSATAGVLQPGGRRAAVLEVRLSTPLHSAKSRDGDAFDGVVVRDVTTCHGRTARPGRDPGQGNRFVRKARWRTEERRRTDASIDRSRRNSRRVESQSYVRRSAASERYGRSRAGHRNDSEVQRQGIVRRRPTETLESVSAPSTSPAAIPFPNSAFR